MNFYKKNLFLILFIFSIGLSSAFADDNEEISNILDRVTTLMSVPDEDADNVIYSTSFDNGMIEFAHSKWGIAGYYSVTVTEETDEGLEKYTITSFFNSEEREFRAKKFEAKLYGQLIELGIIMDVNGLCYALSDQYPTKFEHNTTNSDGVPVHIRVASQTIN